MSLSATPNSIEPGSSSKLEWVSENANRAEIDHGVGKVDPVDTGTRVVAPDHTTTYTIRVFNDDGKSASAHVTVKVVRILGAQVFPVLEFPDKTLERGTSFRVSFSVSFDAFGESDHKLTLEPPYHNLSACLTTGSGIRVTSVTSTEEGSCQNIVIQRPVGGEVSWIVEAPADGKETQSVLVAVFKRSEQVLDRLEGSIVIVESERESTPDPNEEPKGRWDQFLTFLESWARTIGYLVAIFGGVGALIKGTKPAVEWMSRFKSKG